MAIDTSRVLACMDLSDHLRDVADWDDDVVPSIYVYGFLEEQQSFIYGVTGIRLQKFFRRSNRCPLDFRLRNNGAQRWSCNISLNFDTELGKDISFSRRVPFIENIHSPQEAALAIFKAQRAILNPSHDMDRFRSDEFMKSAFCDELFSSADYVTVVISGSPFDLSFVTLPAISSQLSAENILDEESDMVEDALLVLNSNNVMIIITILLGYDQRNKELDNELSLANKKVEKVIFINRGDHVSLQTPTNYDRDCYFESSFIVNEPRLVSPQHPNARMVSGMQEPNWSRQPYSLVVEEICLGFINMIVPMCPLVFRKISKSIYAISAECQALNPFSSDLRTKLLTLIDKYSKEFDAELGQDKGAKRNIAIHLERLAWNYMETQPKLSFRPEGMKDFCPYLDYTGNSYFWHFSSESIKTLTAAKNASPSSNIKHPFLEIVLHCQQNWCLEAMRSIEMIHLDLNCLIDHISERLAFQFPYLMEQMIQRSKSLADRYVQELKSSIQRDLDLQKSKFLFINSRDFHLKVDAVSKKLSEAVGEAFNPKEIHTFSSSIVYYDVVRERVFQNIAALTYKNLIEKFQKSLTAFLFEEFAEDLKNDEMLRQLFTEEASLTFKRLSLISKEHQFLAIINHLAHVQ
ncbi:hypothetical protein DSO57_1014240 [Entomophthora muscae]|uniref:Uncharacterized protein n=1 Tax=Entomophthora muscae TaxID=34485 RepID=A0ACC2TGI1_9FUNG|nr:hypothetical protein DSO57_1014240 [Entomophthora muscae]